MHIHVTVILRLVANYRSDMKAEGGSLYSTYTP